MQKIRTPKDLKISKNKAFSYQPPGR